jgi:hypothetical protein
MSNERDPKEEPVTGPGATDPATTPETIEDLAPSEQDAESVAGGKIDPTGSKGWLE